MVYADQSCFDQLIIVYVTHGHLYMKLSFKNLLCYSFTLLYISHCDRDNNNVSCHLSILGTTHMIDMILGVC